MSALAPTDWILFGVVALVAVNRVFESSRLSESRAVYVVVQAVDFCTVVLLFVVRIEEFAGRVELAIRVFLMLFVTFHMVRNNQVRSRTLQRKAVEARDLADRERQRETAAREGEAQSRTGGEPGSDVVSSPEEAR